MGKERRSEEETEACASDSLPTEAQTKQLLPAPTHSKKIRKGSKKKEQRTTIKKKTIVNCEGPKLEAFAHHSLNSLLQFPQEGARDKWGCRGRERKERRRERQ